MNIANILTIARLSATPFVCALAFAPNYGQRLAAFVIFLAAMFTDVLDGHFARRGRQTALGNYLDPVADKSLILCTMLTLGAAEVIPLWVGLVTLVRELFVSAIRDAGAAGGRVIGANWMGKLKTFLQVVTLAWALHFHARKSGLSAVVPSRSSEQQWIEALAVLTTILAVAFAAAFVWRHREMLKDEKPGAKG